MRLNLLLDELAQKEVFGNPNAVDIQGIVYDPLRVKPGFLYVAITMYTQLDKIEIPDGHDVVLDAVHNGAVAVVLERDIEVPGPIIKIIVPSSRYALARLANKFYDFPSHSMKLVGITGTNGKTTTTHIIESIFKRNYHTGLIGTLYYKINGQIYKSKDTTPEPPDLQEIFTRMKNEEVDFCTMEVSSHGIELFRVEGLRFCVAVFTNLTQDHLDFHKTMEHYRQTKMKLFAWLSKDDYAVVNSDDPSAHYFIESADSKILTYGLKNSADLTVQDIEITIKGMEFTLVTPIGSIRVKPKLVGKFNIYNILSAVGVAISQGIDLETIKLGLEDTIRVSGRFELVDKGQPFSVVVDYAHTPDGIENVLNLARDLKPNRIITVFGCGGDRDKEKRPIMGKIVADFSDYFVITSDNPRNEDPVEIAQQIKKGATHHRFTEIIDRKKAIEHAIKMAQPGDIIMLLGKGHETTQTLKHETIQFNDLEVAQEILSNYMK